MTPFKPQETDDRPGTSALRDPAEATRGIVIPFPGPEARRIRRVPKAEGRRGEILLFLGVRYERLAS